MPDSFARRGRRQDCDPASRTGQQDLNTPFHRAEEAAYAAGQLAKSRPPKMVLMGHSEGALAAQYWTSPEPYKAAILSGTACSRINLPIRLPTLIVRYEHDPWDPQPQLCSLWAGQRTNTSVFLVPGSGHDVARHPDVQRRVISFLNGL
jgi:pimeloyl-ACP methyl ester carboxylesterase